MRLLVKIMPLPQGPANSLVTPQGSVKTAARDPITLSIAVRTEQTFREVWDIVEQRYKTNYLDPSQHSNFLFKKLQDSYGGDLDLFDTVGGIFEDEPDPKMRVVHVIQAPLDRDMSIPATSNLRPSTAQRQLRNDYFAELHRKRRLEEAEYGVALEDLHRDKPLRSREPDDYEERQVLAYNDGEDLAMLDAAHDDSPATEPPPASQESLIADSQRQPDETIDEHSKAARSRTLEYLERPDQTPLKRPRTEERPDTYDVVDSDNEQQERSAKRAKITKSPNVAPTNRQRTLGQHSKPSHVTASTPSNAPSHNTADLTDHEDHNSDAVMTEDHTLEDRTPVKANTEVRANSPVTSAKALRMLRDRRTSTSREPTSEAAEAQASARKSEVHSKNSTRENLANSFAQPSAQRGATTIRKALEASGAKSHASQKPREQARAWTEEEDETLISARIKGVLIPDIVKDLLPNRTVKACQHRYSALVDKGSGKSIEMTGTNTNKLSTRTDLWTEGDERKLLAARDKTSDWKVISNQFPARTAVACRKKYAKLVADRESGSGPQAHRATDGIAARSHQAESTRRPLRGHSGRSSPELEEADRDDVEDGDEIVDEDSDADGAEEHGTDAKLQRKAERKAAFEDKQRHKHAANRAARTLEKEEGRKRYEECQQRMLQAKEWRKAILKARTNDKARADKKSAERERKDSDRADAGLPPIHNLPPVPRKLFSSQPEDGVYSSSAQNLPSDASNEIFHASISITATANRLRLGGVPPPSTTERKSSLAQSDSFQTRNGSIRRSVSVDEESKRDKQRRVLFSSPMAARMSGTSSILNTKRDSPTVVIESPNDGKTRATKQSPSGASQHESIVISSEEEEDEEEDEEEGVEDSGSANERDMNGPGTSLAEVTQTKAKNPSSTRETAAPREGVTGETTHTAGNTQPSPVLPKNSASAANQVRHSPSQKSPASADTKQPALTQKPGLLTEQSTSTQESTVSPNKSPTLARKLRSSAQPSPASAQEAPNVTSKISVATFSPSSLIPKSPKAPSGLTRVKADSVENDESARELEYDELPIDGASSEHESEYGSSIGESEASVSLPQAPLSHTSESPEKNTSEEDEDEDEDEDVEDAEDVPESSPPEVTTAATLQEGRQSSPSDPLSLSSSGSVRRPPVKKPSPDIRRESPATQSQLGRNVSRPQLSRASLPSTQPALSKPKTHTAQVPPSTLPPRAAASSQPRSVEPKFPTLLGLRKNTPTTGNKSRTSTPITKPPSASVPVNGTNGHVSDDEDSDEDEDDEDEDEESDAEDVTATAATQKPRGRFSGISFSTLWPFKSSA
ncbi:hypothetical protein B0A49_06513 [Cryomyces minteri]|uniref:Myb-like domain-containing protein n=1 Tax=Cryomyces minteri TaxID=331657 RepID=A0A4U0X4A5_9PEZI|nr:hypothetical protein B0A49_06513 [Cryomyces minteri]